MTHNELASYIQELEGKLNELNEKYQSLLKGQDESLAKLELKKRQYTPVSQQTSSSPFNNQIFSLRSLTPEEIKTAIFDILKLDKK